jgi:hypothetical protein
MHTPPPPQALCWILPLFWWIPGYLLLAVGLCALHCISRLLFDRYGSAAAMLLWKPSRQPVTVVNPRAERDLRPLRRPPFSY